VTSLALAPEVTATRPPFPYPGLRPFEPEEWSIFFGREAMIDDLIERLAQHRFVLIHGASGSGKSSLVRAGVLPKLARQHLRRGAPWLTCAMRPSGGPLWNLAAEFARLEGRGGDIARITDIIRQFNRRGAKLSQVVGSLNGLSGKRLCLLVDQFEELFRFERETSREEAELFIELLIGEISAEPETVADAGPGAEPMRQPDGHVGNFHVVITMRSEFLGECGRFDRFAEAINRVQYLVPRLTRADLMRAIRQPAQLYGGEVTVDFAERLIADVRGKLDELPLIQHGLMLFWHERAQSQGGDNVILDSAMLNRAGSLAQLLSDHADSVLKVAAPDQPRRAAVERLFRSLIDINAEGQAIRRPQFFRELVTVCGVSADSLRDIIDEFRAEGVSFITPYAPVIIDEATTVDISHESLIRSWRAIAEPQNGWLRHEFEDGLVWRLLLLEAKEFEQNKKRVLSSATTAERKKWLTRQTEAWSGRYGGGWQSVERLLRASRTATIRARRFRRLLFAPLFFVAGIGALLFFDAYAHEIAYSQIPNTGPVHFLWVLVVTLLAVFGLNEIDSPQLINLLADLMLVVVSGWACILIIITIFDYGRDFAGVVRRLMRANSDLAKSKEKRLADTDQKRA
jgi:energy-coupling factor transporter ATP-binding protein EcfA2